MAGLAGGGEVAVTNDGAGIAEALVVRLCSRGYDACVIAGESELTAQQRVVIALDGLRDSDAAARDSICRGVFRLARAFAPRAVQGNCVFVSVQDCGGDFGLSGHERALLGSLAGLVKTAAQEWPSASLKCIDLERDGRDADTLAGLIEAELFNGGSDIEVGLPAHDHRITLHSLLEAVANAGNGAAAVIPLPDNAVVVCSGGARGVTAATMMALAAAHPTRFALLGRTPLEEEPAECRGIEDDAGLKRALLMAARERGEKVTPASLGSIARRVLAQREIRHTIKTIQQSGGDAVYIAVDVTDAAQLTAALAGVRERWGSIDVVVHGAGVVADKLIAEKTDEQFDRVWSTKVKGLSALLAATADDRLRALILFASVAARSGNVGQCDYAMANEALNKLAALEARRRGADCIVKSLNWGPWEAGMVTPSLKAYFEEHGVALIPLKRGGEMLLEELTVPSVDPDSGERRIEIVLGGAPQRTSIAGAEESTQGLDVFVDRHTHPHLADHSIDGTAVIPLVMVLEWFSRTAEAFAPDKHMRSCERLRVFRGVRLDGFNGAGDWFRITVEPTSSPDHDEELHLNLVLCDPLDPKVRYYGATIILTSAAPNGAASLPDSAPSQDFPADLAPLAGPTYGGTLFHGAAFQVIGDGVHVAADGAHADMVGVTAMKWRPEAWCNDVALLDGGLQLALLWSEQRLGGRALPTSVGRYRRYFDGAVEGTVRCHLRGRAEGDMTGVCHIQFVDQQGRLIAEMEDLETHKRP